MSRKPPVGKTTVSKSNLAVLALYGLLTLILTYPLPCTMNKALAGESTDVYINPWADWWTKKALSEGLDFYQTDYMFYPQGTSLAFHSFSHANTFISLLLAPLVGRLAAYNITILLAYVLSSFSMYLLASHLTGCPPAAFIAGLVFAFCPYHIFEGAHPVLATTQWIPLFVLAITRTLYGTDTRWIRQPLLAALWFLLTALSSWHLMIMLAGWMALYLLYGLIFERINWTQDAPRVLFLFAVAAGLLVTPFLWPIIRELLTTDTTYMAIDVQYGYGNDLLSFFIPNQQHPLFGSLVSDINDQIGFTEKRPAYLGYVSLGLAVAGVATARRSTRFWLLAGLVSLFLSLGSQIKFNGAPLHTFHLPWAAPIIKLLRHPFRLNVFLFFSLAILVGFGGRRLYGWIATRNKPLAYLSVASAAGLVLFEYLVVPFPTTQLAYSPFLHQLAEEEGEFAVADFPMGRKLAKYYLFYQTIHGKKIVDGVVSRTPDNAYAFVDADPLLGPLHAWTAPTLGSDIKQHLSALADQSIRYIIVHKDLLTPNEKKHWQKLLADLPPPFYEDDLIVVYSTYPEAWRDFELAYELGDTVGSVRLFVAPVEITQGGSLLVNLSWDNQMVSSFDLDVCLALINGVGDTSQETCWDSMEDDYHIFQIDPHLPGGEYTLTTSLVEPETRRRVAEAKTSEAIVVKELLRVFDVPTLQHVASAAFGQDLRLLGYDVAQGAEDLRLTLHWRAEREMPHYYKFFVHLLTHDTSEVVTQADVVPRNWAYPTTWWEAGEVVSDDILLPLTDVPPGTYRLIVGVYDPATGERLLVPQGVPGAEERVVELGDVRIVP